VIWFTDSDTALQQNNAPIMRAAFARGWVLLWSRGRVVSRLGCCVATSFVGDVCFWKKSEAAA
jgi:hypothetical protein